MRWAGVAKEAAWGITAVCGRSARALVGVEVGIGSVIAMVSTGEIVREQAMRQSWPTSRLVHTDFADDDQGCGQAARCQAGAHTRNWRSIPATCRTA